MEGGKRIPHLPRAPAVGPAAPPRCTRLVSWGPESAAAGGCAPGQLPSPAAAPPTPTGPASSRHRARARWQLLNDRRTKAGRGCRTSTKPPRAVPALPRAAPLGRRAGWRALTSCPGAARRCPACPACPPAHGAPWNGCFWTCLLPSVDRPLRRPRQRPLLPSGRVQGAHGHSRAGVAPTHPCRELVEGGSRDPSVHCRLLRNLEVGTVRSEVRTLARAVPPGYFKLAACEQTTGTYHNMLPDKTKF